MLNSLVWPLVIFFISSHFVPETLETEPEEEVDTDEKGPYTRHVFKVRSGFKLPPIGCTVREHACAGSYMCSLANVCHFVAGRSLFYVKKD